MITGGYCWFPKGDYRGNMETINPEAIYAEASALLARYRAAGVTPDLAALADPPRRRTSGTKAERAEQRRDRHRRNALAHREAQAERDQDRPPTRKQRQLLWCLGYRGPAPKDRAEVAALVAALRDHPRASPLGIVVEAARSAKESGT
jgi:hypothetical protein